MTIITTGVKTPNNTIVARQDLRELIKDKYLLNLYLLATQRLQQTDQQDILSYYQLSGIHGRPFIAYDNVQGSGFSGFGGYCTHSSVLFPPWHRPYLALYEQTLYKIVNDIAHEFTSPDKQQYINAALKFRIPYWDWAADSYLPDIVAKQETVRVTTPKEGEKTIKNPLYAYEFHPIYADFGDGSDKEKTWEAWPRTIRWPSTEDSFGRSQPDKMEFRLKNNALTTRDRTYNLLTQSHSYEAFSNDGFLGEESDPRSYDSLESIHGKIHVKVGEGGHMNYPDYAAFDPVFWMHHAQVDRLFAIWQALNPTSYVTRKQSGSGNFTTKAGTFEDGNTPLWPFRKSPTDFWTSAEARDTRTFGYTYPELEKWSDLSPQQKRVRVGLEVNRLYGKTGPIAVVRPEIFAKVAADDVEGQKVLKGEKDAPEVKQASYYEWVVNILVEKYAARGSFSVNIFLGDFDPDHSKWGDDANLVGTHTVFANKIDSTGCERCLDDHEKQKLVTGTVPLTGALGDKLGQDKLGHLDPDLVVPYLKANLHWRLQKNNDTAIHRTDVSTLKISVGYSIVEVPKEPFEFPKWGEIHIVPEVTAGRPGGSG